MKKYFSLLFLIPVILVLLLLLYFFPTQTKINTFKISDDGKIDSEVDKIIENKDESISLLFAGDVMLARSIGVKILEGDDPFKYVKEEFSKHDLVIVNLETSVGNIGSPQIGKLYTFQAPIESIKIMRNSGVDLVSLANNHIMDYGDTAFNQMTELLKKNDIKYFGADKTEDLAFNPLEIEINSTKIHFYGFNDVETNFNSTYDNTPGSAWFNKERIQEQLEKSFRDADVTIPFVHWGTEFSFEPNQRQDEFAKIMISSGADIVIGGHPHVIQPSTSYKDKQIINSLGNFIFDQMYQDAAKGNMLVIKIEKKEIISTSLIPIQINSEGFPEIID